MEDLLQAGAWTAFRGDGRDGERVCGVSTRDGGEGIDQRVFFIKHIQDNDFLSLQIFKLAWNFPLGTHIRYELLIDGRRAYVGSGMGIGNFLEWVVRRDILREFSRDLRAGETLELRVLARGEPPMTVSLSGIPAMLSTLGHCMTTHTGVTNPSNLDIDGIAMQRAGQ